ncbi:DUF805 domain-containing protein [Kutzneria sp. NPDC052558]|uniref:DUF805 domain-containing protein n=1 Tax=Kutzneria sp. NPDC052558 TaxID=3364121 RepID=UPI0037C76A44
MQFIGEPTRSIGFGPAVLRALQLTFRKRGRASRREFWFFFLAYWGLFAVSVIAASALEQDWLVALGYAVYLVGLLPFISVSIRRLHDIGRNGWWSLGMISVIGWLLLIAFWTERGQPGENRFGPPPR